MSSMQTLVTCCCFTQTIVMHRATFANMLRTMGGTLLYHPDYLTRLLDKSPSERSAPEIAKLVSYLASIPRFAEAEVPAEVLEVLAKSVSHEAYSPGGIVCKQGTYRRCPYATACLAACDKHANYACVMFLVCSMLR